MKEDDSRLVGGPLIFVLHGGSLLKIPFILMKGAT